jgi:putative hydrolase of the HAD superfamily
VSRSPKRRLVFDAGGVLVGDAFSRLFPEIAAHLGVELDDVLAFYHEQRADLWQGGMAEEDFWTRMVERFPTLDSSHWRRRLLELSSPLPGADKLEAWGTQAEIWILSNHRHEWLTPLLDEAGALPHIDRLLISSTEGTMKPNLEAFEPLVEGVAAEGREQLVLFVDDKEANLRAAEQVGIATVLADPDGAWHAHVDHWLRDGS